MLTVNHSDNHLHLGETVWYIPDPDVRLFAFIFLMGTAFFGWYLALVMRQPATFRLKLAIIFFVPALLATTYVTSNVWDFSHEYKIMLTCAFIVLQNILYWKAVKNLTDPMGFHRAALAKCMEFAPDPIWMKDLDHKFTYTNKATRDLLFPGLTARQVFGKTGIEIAAKLRLEGIDYQFGEICADSDAIAIESGTPSKFLESGNIGSEFVSLQVFKAQLHDEKGSVIGTIGMGRDLTYDCLDHEEIEQLLLTGDYKAAFKAFTKHKNRYKFEGCTQNSDSCSQS